jgi:hypothetical protein
VIHNFPAQHSILQNPPTPVSRIISPRWSNMLAGCGRSAIKGGAKNRCHDTANRFNHEVEEDLPQTPGQLIFMLSRYVHVPNQHRCTSSLC